MSNEVKVISATGLPATGRTQIVQHGNDSVAIPNYGTINIPFSNSSLLCLLSAGTSMCRSE